MIEHTQNVTEDIDGPEPSQKEEATVSLPVLYLYWQTTVFHPLPPPGICGSAQFLSPPRQCRLTMF